MTYHNPTGQPRVLDCVNGDFLPNYMRDYLNDGPFDAAAETARKAAFVKAGLTPVIGGMALENGANIVEYFLKSAHVLDALRREQGSTGWGSRVYLGPGTLPSFTGDHNDGRPTGIGLWSADKAASAKITQQAPLPFALENWQIGSPSEAHHAIVTEQTKVPRARSRPDPEIRDWTFRVERLYPNDDYLMDPFTHLPVVE